MRNDNIKTIASQSQQPNRRVVHWAPERPVWKSLPVDLGMRAAGRLAVGLNAAFGSRAGNHVGILTYHRVTERLPGFAFPLHNVEPKRFSGQLSGLLERGFHFVPLSRVLEAAACGETLPPRTVVVTFDDGFASVYTKAFPILQRLKIPATIFLNTAYLDSDDPFPFDAWGVTLQGQVPTETLRPLRTAECQEMLASGLIEIGAHTHTHEDFRGRPNSFHVDLVQSMEIVRDRFHLEDVTFAFPYGGVHTGFAGDELAETARAAGVKCGLTTMAELIDLKVSPFKWGRFNVFAWDTSATLTGKLAGWYSWAPKARRAVGHILRRARRSNNADLVMSPIGNRRRENPPVP
jgi:peptidoglycan/xylan/chitin deacetylase (PgdA/CDA1 family)